MKKKSLFLLASGVCAAALIGGTFASWAVTDNADPFSIKVSTGDVDTETADYVTLEWGESQNMSNVSNLALNTIRKAGVLDLRANTTATATPNGTLSYAVTGGTHIVAGLEVKIYQGNLSAENGVIAAATASAATAVTFTDGAAVINVTKNVANLYTVAVNLKSSVDAAALAQMAGEKATLTFDWNKGTGVLEAHTLYAHGFSSQPYVYAWNGSSVNHEFPGVAMTLVSGTTDYYTAQVNTTYTKVIFSTAGEAQKSGDITIEESFTGGKNLFTYDGTSGDAKGTFSVMGDVKTPEYYVVGSFTATPWTTDPANLTATKMTYVAESGTQGQPGYVEEHYTLASLTLAANAELKVYEVLNKQWYSSANPWENCGFTISQDGNVVVTAAGTYTIDLYFSGANGNYVIPTLHA